MMMAFFRGDSLIGDRRSSRSSTIVDLRSVVRVFLDVRTWNLKPGTPAHIECHNLSGTTNYFKARQIYDLF